MISSTRRRRFMLATSVVVLAVGPWLFAPVSSAIAQVATTSTTDPSPTTTTTKPPPPPPAPRRTTTTTTTTTLPPTTTTVTTTTTTLARTTTTRRPPPTTTTLLLTTTSAFVPSSSAEPGGGGGVSGSSGGLPGWSLPFVGAGAMLGAILLATGVVRFATHGIPALGRGLGTLTYKTSSGWGKLTSRGTAIGAPMQFAVVRPTLGARIAGFFLALTAPFRRVGHLFTRRRSSTDRPRLHRRNTVGGLWARIVLRGRMARARFSSTRSSVDGRKRYWWLRFRRFIPWLR